MPTIFKFSHSYTCSICLCLFVFISGRLAFTQEAIPLQPSPQPMMIESFEQEIIEPEIIEAEEMLPEPRGIYDWILPTRWIAGPNWEKSVELGINGSDGNANSLSLLASGFLKRETDRSIWKNEIVYGKNEAAGVITQHYGFLDSRYDLKLAESRWTYFNLFRLEYDEFKDFDYRVTLNMGLGYDFIRTDIRKLTGRFGAGASREFGGRDTEWVPEALFGMDYEHQLTKRQKLSLTVDYFPSWEDFEDYRLVSRGSWELLLDEETNLSLKVGFIDRYDSTPFDRQPNDLDYFVTLLWKI